MAFRGKGTTKVAKKPCWCGAEVIITKGKDTDGKPYKFKSCSEDVFHDVKNR
jgi:hypothetical protein